MDKLKDFHRRRLQVLVEAGPDLLAFETIPNKLEAQVCSSTICVFYKVNENMTGMAIHPMIVCEQIVAYQFIICFSSFQFAGHNMVT